ncbi:Glycosyl transferase, group 1 [Chitinispirillum alkaliphilum]|nr:Glycosyl transferase, group 1 [Chitinispirillum alkaliphilum]
MHILYISSEYPPETGYGGIGTYVKYISEIFASNGHNVYVISRSETGTGYKKIQNGVTIYRIPVLPYALPQHRAFYLFRKLCYKTIPHTLNRLAWAKSAWLAYKNVFSSIDLDVIEFPECGAEGFYFVRNNLPCFTRLHTPWAMIRKIDNIKEHILDIYFSMHLEKYTAMNSFRVSSPSKALAQRLGNEWHLKNISVYPNPIKTNDFKGKNEKKYWIYTGRVEYLKGVHILLQAYTRLKEIRTPPPLLLIGRPFGVLPNKEKYGDYIESLIRVNDLENDVTWIPGVPHHDIPSYLRKSSVAFFPSLWENFPYACMEAMASGVAVCASDCGGYTEMINDKEDGILFETGDIESLLLMMKKMLDNPELVKKLGTNSTLKTSAKFESKIIYEKAFDFYNYSHRIKK